MRSPLQRSFKAFRMQCDRQCTYKPFAVVGCYSSVETFTLAQVSSLIFEVSCSVLLLGISA